MNNNNPGISSNPKNLTTMYTIHQCLYWTVVCCIVSFAATYLTEKGFAVSTVGIILFSANMLSFLVQLFLAGIADKAGNSKSIKLLMTVLSVIPLIIMVLFLIAELPMWLMAILYVPMVAGFDMELPLMNSVVIFYQKRSCNISYGIARAFGAAAFGAASLGMGYAIKGLGSNIMLIVAIIFTVAYIIFIFLYPSAAALTAGEGSGLHTLSSTDKDAAAQPLSIGLFILRYKWYAISLLGVMMFGAVHLASENYLIEIVRPLGGDSANVGTALMIGTFLEMPATLVAVKVYKKLKAHKMWMLIGISYTVRMLIYALSTSIGMVYLAQVLQLTSYAPMPPSQLYYSNDCVDDNDMVKGQSTSTAFYSLGNALGNLFGGLAVSAVGVSSMLKGCVAGAFLGFVIVAVFVPIAVRDRNRTIS